ncbi:Aspartic peptidase domain superfamily [Sesbania bispinosa]|nr:Aspartic peptidase domain superfamily [Sesbania bispinosa]
MDNRIRIEEVQEESDTEEKALAAGLAKTRSFRILFGQLGLDHDAQQEAAKALVGIIKNHGGELSATNAPLTRLARSHATAIVFREPMLQGVEFCNNKPLYIESSIEGVRVRHALVDNGSGVNILPLHLFRMLNIPCHRLRASDIILSTFHGEPVELGGCINAVLEVRPIKSVNAFRIVYGDRNYHLLLGRPWIHLHQCIPSTLHQCIKSNFKGKEIEIQGVRAPFEASESHLIDVALFDKLAPPGSSHLEMEHVIALQGHRRIREARGSTRPTEAFKRPRSRTENGMAKEYLPNGEVRWRIL